MPLLPLHPVWRLDRHLLLRNLLPVRTQNGPARFQITLIHRPLHLVAPLPVNLLKQLIHSVLALHFLVRHLLQNVLLDRVPIPMRRVRRRVLGRAGTRARLGRDLFRDVLARVPFQARPLNPLVFEQLDFQFGFHYFKARFGRYDPVSEAQAERERFVVVDFDLDANARFREIDGYVVRLEVALEHCDDYGRFGLVPFVANVWLESNAGIKKYVPKNNITSNVYLWFFSGFRRIVAVHFGISSKTALLGGKFR